MPHISTKTSHENLKKQTETVQSLLMVLRSMDKNTGPPLYTLLHEKNINLSSVLETLIKSSDNEIIKQRICELGLLQVIADLFKQPIKHNDNASIEMRYHACTLLTNLSVGNTENKRLMTSIDGFIVGLLEQLNCSNEELQRMAACVLRNLSLNADEISKKVLRNDGIIPALMKCAMKAKEESTLECLLSALWNVSGHSEENKKDICEFPDSLKFIVSLLVQENTSIIENGGGILKNISSYVTIHENLRQILRQNKCFEVLLKHLQLQNAKIVSNACGTLWNLSARCAEDQCTLLELGAVASLGQLVTSEHEAICMASSAALKNLVIFRMSNSASNNLNHEFNKHEGKRAFHYQTHNNPASVTSIEHNLKNNPDGFLKSKAHQALGNLKKNVCEYDEPSDEMIDFSRRYEEFHERPHIWSRKSSIDEMSACVPFSYGHVVSKRNHVINKNFNILANGDPTSKVPPSIKTNGTHMELSNISSHIPNIYKTCKQDFIPMSPPEQPKHYCTEDTPDSHSVYHGSVNNVSDFNSMEIDDYKSIDTPINKKSLNSNHSIYKELESSSPKEVPTKYCTEDTPDGFSRGSSLSSLSIKSLENFDQKKFFYEKVIEQSTGLPCINENETLNIIPHISRNSNTPMNKLKLCSQDGLYGSKSVSFDDTPLMFSRSSSLASLSSFDAHSVHSSLVSEYSMRASSVVSPSELPNSPGDSPPSLEQSKEFSQPHENVKAKRNINMKCQPIVFETINEKEHDSECLLSDKEDENADELLCQVMQAAMPKDEKHLKSSKRIVSRVVMNAQGVKPSIGKESVNQKSNFITPSAYVTSDSSFSDTMKTYAVEGTPLELSRSASLSILTLDDGMGKKVGDMSESCIHFVNFNPKGDEMSSCEDSLHAYCTERTPITFSRNESLSPLCSKDSPAKLVDISFDHQIDFAMENEAMPFLSISNFATSTPSSKCVQTSRGQNDVDGSFLASIRRNNDDIKCLETNSNNFLKEFSGTLSSSSSSSSFSCSSNESTDVLPSIGHCIQIAMPKRKGRKKKSYAGLERKSCQGSSLNQTTDFYQDKRNSELEKSSLSEDEVNNTVIYKGQEFCREDEKKNISADKSDVNDLADMIDDFYTKTSIEDRNLFSVEHKVHSEKLPQLLQNTNVDTTSSKQANLISSVQKENSRSKLRDFFRIKKKKTNLQKSSPSKDDIHRKFRLSTIKKSQKSQQKHGAADKERL